MPTPNYTLGRGKVYFARFTAGQTPGPFRYVGNSPEFSLAVETEMLDHFNADSGLRQKDASLALETTRTGTLVCDDIQVENVALFFLGSASVLTTASASALTEDLDAVEPGMFYQIGLTESNKVGLRGLANVSVESNPAATTYVAGTDYNINLDTGMLEIIEGGGIASGDDITVNYDVSATTQQQIISGDNPVEGALRFVADNPRGENRDIFLPYCKITPNGDFALKGDDWQQLSFSLEAMKPTVGEAVYVNGRPVAGA